jgi:membrane protein required for colicin V production
VNVIDATFAVVVVVSMLFGLLRGFVREAASLIGWVAGLALALRYASALGAQLPFATSWPNARTLVGGALIIVGCLIVAAIVGRLLHAALAAAKLSGTDRALGAAFGLGRGLLLALLVAAVVVHEGFARERFWTESVSAPYLETALKWFTSSPQQRKVPPGIVPGA